MADILRGKDCLKQNNCIFFIWKKKVFPYQENVTLGLCTILSPLLELAKLDRPINIHFWIVITDLVSARLGQLGQLFDYSEMRLLLYTSILKESLSSLL